MRDAVISVYESRKNLALTLKDTRSVVGKLENILGVGIHTVCFLFYLSIFNVSIHLTMHVLVDHGSSYNSVRCDQLIKAPDT